MNRTAKSSSRKRKSRSTQRTPRRKSWVWWLGGILIAMVYVWLFYYFFVGPTGFRWRALYGDQNYPEGFEIQGIDISHYQGKIDWRELRTAMINKCPVRFVIVKATEGASVVDENFDKNFYNARDYGFIRGAYHFWSVKSSARSQAHFFLSRVKLEEGDLPPVLDVEHKKKDQPVDEFQREILLWLHTVEDRYHVKPIIYTNYKFKLAYLNDKRFDGYPYWIAHYYVDKMEYQGEWKFWQHTDAGQLPGIRGAVDLNIYNGSYYDLQQLCILE